MKVSLGIHDCLLGCGGVIAVELDDGDDDNRRSSPATLRAEANRIAERGGWRCSDCDYGLPLTGELLWEIERRASHLDGWGSVEEVSAADVENVQDTPGVVTK